jgi:hypothetical protein
MSQLTESTLTRSLSQVSVALNQCDVNVFERAQLISRH